MRQRTTYHGNNDSSLVNLNARIPRDLWQKVKLSCFRDGKPLQGYIGEAVRERLDRATKKSKR